MELPLGTLVVTIIFSVLIGVVVFGVCGLVLYQIFVKKKRKSLRRDVEDIQEAPTLALRRKNTLQKGYRRELPFVKTSTNVGQIHSSWTVPLTSHSNHRSREDIGNPLTSNDPWRSGHSSQQASIESSGLSDGTIIIRRGSAIPAALSPSVLRREQHIFDPNYVPIARRSAPTELSRERTPSLSPRSHHRRIFSHPTDVPRLQEPRRCSSVTPSLSHDYLTWSNGPRRSRSLDGVLATDDSKLLVRSNRDSAIDINSPPNSSNSAKRQSLEMSDVKFLEYAASGQWLTGAGISSSGNSIKDPVSPLKSPAYVSNHARSLDHSYDDSPSRPSRSPNSEAQKLHSPRDSSTVQAPQAVFDSHKRYPPSKLPSAPGHTLSPLNEFTEPNPSIDSVFKYSRSVRRNDHMSSGSTLEGSQRHGRERIFEPPVPAPTAFAQTVNEHGKFNPPSPTLSAKSVDSEALSEITVSNLSGLTPRPRKLEEMFKPIQEETSSPSLFGKASNLEDITSRTAWSPSLLSLKADSFPFPTSQLPSLPPPIEAPDLSHISDIYGFQGDFKTPRDSLAISELERAVRELGDRLQWMETDEDTTPVPGTPIVDKGKTVLRDIQTNPEHRLSVISRHREGRFADSRSH